LKGKKTFLLQKGENCKRTVGRGPFPCERSLKSLLPGKRKEGDFVLAGGRKIKKGERSQEDGKKKKT